MKCEIFIYVVHFVHFDWARSHVLCWKEAEHHSDATVEDPGTLAVGCFWLTYLHPHHQTCGPSDIVLLLVNSVVHRWFIEMWYTSWMAQIHHFRSLKSWYICWYRYRELSKSCKFETALDPRYLIQFRNLFLQGNAEKSRIIMVGDTLKKASNSAGGGFIDIEDFGNTEYGILIFPFS